MPPPDAARAAPARAEGDPRFEQLVGELNSQNINPLASRQAAHGALGAALRAFDEELDNAWAEAWNAIEGAVDGLRQYLVFVEGDAEDAPDGLRAFGRELLALRLIAESARDNYAWRVKRARRALQLPLQRND
jgi:hypothetical protein